MDREKAATNVRKRSGASGAHAKAAAAKKRQQARHKNTAKGRSSRRTSGRSDIAAVIARLPKKVLAAAAVLIVLIIVIVFAARGCGVSHKTPEKVVRTLVEAYTSGSESKAKKCYGVSKADDNLQQEMDATINYYKAFAADKTEITQCGQIYQNGKVTYMYVIYDLVLKNGQSYPCISTYMVQKKDDGKYYVMTPSEITDDMSKQAATKYAEFMNTQAYKDYTTAYDKFIKKNPGYEEQIAAKLK